MRRFGGTSLTVMLALILALAFAAVAAASPGEAQARATLSFGLDLDDAVAQPFDRWLKELAGMTALTIDSMTWEGGEAMALRLRMNGTDAWELALLADEAGVSLESGLMAEGAVRLRDAEAAEARALMAGLRGAIAGPEQWTMTAGEFSALVRGAAATMDRWGGAADGTEGVTCTAISDFLDALADIADREPDAPWLSVTVVLEEDPAAFTAQPGEREAPAELPGVLAMEAFWATMRAIAAE